MKNKEWLKDSLAKEMYNAEMQGIFSSSSMSNVLYEDIFKLIDQLDEPEITDPTISKKETVEVPKFVADWIKPLKYSHLGYHIGRMEENQEIHNWFIDNRIKYGLRDCRDLLAIVKIYGYTIEPPKTLQVIIKNYDSTVFTTELPEDEAMKLIEGWKGNE